MPLSLAELRIQRALAPTPAGTRYAHKASCVGPLGWLCGLLLGRQFETMPPGVMERPRQLAAQPSAVPAARKG